MGRKKQRTPPPTKASDMTYPYAWGESSYGGTAGRNRDLIRSDAGSSLAYLLVGTVNRCIEIIVNAVNNIEWELVTGEGENEHIICSSLDRLPRHPLAVAMRGVYVEQSIPLRKLMAYSELIYGETYIEKLPTEILKPRGVKWLNPLWTEPQIASGHIQFYRYSNPWGESAILSTDDVAYEHTFNPQNDLRGYSVVNAVLDEINVDRDLKRFLKAFFRNNARPGMVISPKDAARYSAADVMTIKEQIQNYIKGVDNGSSTLVSPISANYETFDSPEVDRQYQISEKIRTEIYMGFGVPPSMAGDSGGATYKDGEEVLEAFYFNTIGPMAQRQAAFINTFLMPYFEPGGQTTFRVKPPQPRSIIANEKAKSDLVNAQLNATLLSLADAARKQGLTPDPVLEDLYIIGGVPVPKSALSTYWERLHPPPAVLPPAPQPPSAIETPPTPQLPIGKAHTHSHEADSPFEFPQPLPLEEWRAEALKELIAWQRHVKAGKVRPFVPVHTLGAISDLAQAGDFDSAFAAVRYEPFKTTLASLDSLFEGQKTFADTRDEFEVKILDIIMQGFDSDIKRGRFVNLLHRLIEKLGLQAYKDGLADAGVTDTTLDATDQAEVDALIAENKAYALSFAQSLYADSYTQEQLFQRPKMWANKTLTSFYYAGLAAGNKNAMMQWWYGDTEHCADCLRLNGQRHRMKDWVRSGYLPKSLGTKELACGGFNCACQIVPARGQSYGDF